MQDLKLCLRKLAIVWRRTRQLFRCFECSFKCVCVGSPVDELDNGVAAAMTANVEHQNGGDDDDDALLPSNMIFPSPPSTNITTIAYLAILGIDFV